jgi:AcrR family transcriptional regulator
MPSDLRQEVLKAAKALFMDKGYDAVGMREIAQAVGRQPTQVYRLALSKADILAEIIIELNQTQIRKLPVFLRKVRGTNAFERSCSYLQLLYQSDIKHMAIRAVGAAYGWTWNGEYESAVVQQAQQLLQPVADWMEAAGLKDVPARCYTVWCLYYVGYRRAVMHGGTASECLSEIRPSLLLAFAGSSAGHDQSFFANHLRRPA